jgi:DNA mismatch repair protein MutS
MADRRDELTPMMAQYFELTAQYDDALVLFQNGDFYQTYCEAAEEVARRCELTLTERSDSTGTYRMAGIPVENAASYVETLLDAGYRVAVAEQVEDAEEASGLVDRAVTQVVTPGTLVDDELLGAGTTNYVAAVAAAGDDAADSAAGAVADDSAAGGDEDGSVAGGDADETWAVAAVDVSTGECLVTGVDTRERAVEELQRLAPAELLCGPAADVAGDDFDWGPMVTDHGAGAFDADAARDTVSAYAPNPDAVVADETELRATGAVLAYAEYTQGDDGPLEYVSRVTRYDPREYLRLDATAVRSLELFETPGHAAGEPLVDVLDDTSSALGRRLLGRWLRRPLVDESAIDARLDAVEEWTERGVTREEVRDLLTDVYDVERLVSRVSRGRANARDLRSLKTTLDVIPEVKAAMTDAEADRLRTLREALDELDDVRSLIDRAIQPDPPVELTEGGVIREGFDETLDDLRTTEREGREWVADLEARERERTGIDSLEVGHNQVHGYYIEVTKPNLDRVPDDYTRRQTLKNAERYYTPDLKRREDEILGAAERADKLEYDLFTEVRADAAAETDRIQSVADALAELDVLATLAAVAVENDYVRPEVGADDVRIRAGRHPVVERNRERFVPNDADFTDADVAVITGPNMSGKSTYMRQVALICVLAQTGSFVPAESASLPVLDRVFTRVGASDDIAGGQSTFMREMAELTDILHGATEDSLVLLDEVGRGTSTTDGLAIAWATTEFVHDEVGATTLFATHYHELTDIADERERVTNLHFTASREDGEVTFLHSVAEGASSSSYGVEVAEMAGVPDAVVERSRSLVDDGVPSRRGGPVTLDDFRPATNGDGGTSPADGSINGHAPGATNGSADGAANGQDGVPSAENGQDGVSSDDALSADVAPAALDVADELRRLDVADTTPLEALNLLNDLKRRLDEPHPQTDSEGR